VILSLDPGVTTGFAIKFDNGEVKADQVKCSHRAMYDMLVQLDPDEIVFERFTYQRRDKVVLWPVEVIGIIRLFAEQFEVPLFAQTPAQAMNLFTDDKIKAMDLWVPGLVHGMDAMRHLLYYMVITKGEKQWLENLRPQTTISHRQKEM
jgi:hypothetical protein